MQVNSSSRSRYSRLTRATSSDEKPDPISIIRAGRDVTKDALEDPRIERRILAVADVVARRARCLAYARARGGPGRRRPGCRA